MGYRKKPKNLENLELLLNNHKIVIPWFIVEKTLKDYNFGLNPQEIKEHCNYLISEVRDSLKSFYVGNRLELKSDVFKFIFKKKEEGYILVGAKIREDSNF